VERGMVVERTASPDASLLKTRVFIIAAVDISNVA
jgi:hypothetical protein